MVQHLDANHEIDVLNPAATQRQQSVAILWETGPSGNSTMVEHPTTHPEIKGSNPAPLSVPEKMQRKK